MVRTVLTPMLLLAVLIQTAFGCFWRHSHEPVASRPEPAVSAAHGHHHPHGHDHHHGGHRHGPPAAGHFHFGGESDGDHQHEQSGDDTSSYVVSRPVAPPTLDLTWIGYAADTFATATESAEPSRRPERSDAFGRSGWPSGQRLSLLGVWLV